MGSDHTRREFEWSHSLSDLSYSSIKVELVLTAKEFDSRPGKTRKVNLLGAANFLRSVALELEHMSEGVKSDE
jgi:hypothetical protein